MTYLGTEYASWLNKQTGQINEGCNTELPWGLFSFSGHLMTNWRLEDYTPAHAPVFHRLLAFHRADLRAWRTEIQIFIEECHRFSAGMHRLSKRLPRFSSPLILAPRFRDALLFSLVKVLKYRRVPHFFSALPSAEPAISQVCARRFSSPFVFSIHPGAICFQLQTDPLSLPLR